MKWLISVVVLVGMAITTGPKLEATHGTSDWPFQCDVGADPAVPDNVISLLDIGGILAKVGLVPSNPSWDSWWDANKNEAVTLADVAYCLDHSGSVNPARRDANDQPFTILSIWNRPIGQQATYVDAQIDGVTDISIDGEFISVNASDPLKTLTGTDPFTHNPNASVRVRSTMSHNGTYNGCATFLTEDNTSVWQGQPLTLTAGGNPSWTFTHGTSPQNIKTSDGIGGCHGGSGLSGYGGSIRAGELTSSDPINHALKVNLFSYYYFDPGEGDCHDTGYRWPATRADGGCDVNEANCESPLSPGGCDFYGGSVAGVHPGALLAVLPSVDCAATFTVASTEKLCGALQQYGAYIVDNTFTWSNRAAFNVDVHIADEEWAANIDEGEVIDLLELLHLVSDNAAGEHTSGGGWARGPFAPIFN